MKDDRLRFALFGTGDFGPHFAPYVNEFAELVAICDPNAAAQANFAKHTGLDLPGFDHHEKLLDAVDVDGVVIASPNVTHKEIALAAAQRGKHVFCEKAMTPTVPDCWEMVRACRHADVRLMVGHKRRLRPPWARMIELRQKLGKVLAITSCAYYDARPYDHKGWWTRRDQCGGTLPVIGVHIVDWMRAMCGDVITVRALAAPQVDTRYDFPDTLHVSLQFASGAIATLNVSMVYPLLKFRESGGPMAVCEQGGMRFIPFLEHLDLHWQHRDDSEPHFERFDDLGFNHAYRQEFGDFVRWIIDGTEPCLTWQEGLRCVEVMEAAHRSADEGGLVIKLPLYPELE
jgi:UDP-N-acetyl-2-amino-2-deoxyglucuronate dehydrogenase